MLKDQTLNALDDFVPLRHEADELWDRFVIDVEKGHYEGAVISSNEAPKGPVVAPTRGFNFIFVKTNGSWRTKEYPSVEKNGLTDSVVRSLMERIDWLYENRHANAILLYLADDWSLTATSLVPNIPTPKIDRAMLATELRSSNATSTNTHRRNILKISVSDDRRSAIVESDESETLTLNGQVKMSTSHSVDSLAIEGASVVLKSSQTELQSLK